MTSGAWGEQTAAAFLERAGWRIVQRNFRTRFGEIDLIAENGRYLAFVEVKTRQSARFAAACEHVTPRKQARIIAAAEEWLQEHPAEVQPRFDVIEVYGQPGAAAPQINHLENAFGGGG